MKPLIRVTQKDGQIPHTTTTEVADILHIADDTDMRTLVRCILKTHHVVGAASAPEALALLARWTPDLILLDLVLSRTGASQGGRALAGFAAMCRLPVLILSGCPDTARFAHELGVPHLAKPFAASDLRRAVALALGARVAER